MDIRIFKKQITQNSNTMKRAIYRREKRKGGRNRLTRGQKKMKGKMPVWNEGE